MHEIRLYLHGNFFYKGYNSISVKCYTYRNTLISFNLYKLVFKKWPSFNIFIWLLCEKHDRYHKMLWNYWRKELKYYVNNVWKYGYIEVNDVIILF